YSLVVTVGDKPDGLDLNKIPGVVSGTPAGPQPPKPPIAEGGSYTYGFLLSAQDAATPPNTASGPVNFTVNDQMKSHFGDFVAFPYNKSVNRRTAFSGGTAPFTFSIGEGALPSGMSIADGASLKFTG